MVDNVPFALAVTAQTTNLVFGALTNTYETVFGVPEDLGLQKGDVGFGHRILKQVNNATIRDPSLRSGSDAVHQGMHAVRRERR